MLYFKCVTCKKLLANREIPYKLKLKQICNNVNLSESEKTELKKKLVDEMMVTRQCCRMRLMSFVSLIDIVK